MEMSSSVATQRLVSTRVTLEPLGTFQLKGRTEAVAAFRVLSLDRPVGVFASSFVGRDTEITRLQAVFQSAVAAPRTRLAVLLGSPGLGKSRLIKEFLHRLGDSAFAITAHCEASGGGSFLPMVRALRGVLKLDQGATAAAMKITIEVSLPAVDADRSRIATGLAALVTGAPVSQEESFFVLRRWLGALSTN